MRTYSDIEILEMKDLHPAAKVVWLYRRSYPRVRMSLVELSRRLHMHVSTIGRSVREIEAKEREESE